MQQNVRHVVFNARNPEHVAAVRRLRGRMPRGSLERLLLGYPGVGPKLLLQFEGRRVVGFTEFTPRGKETEINYMHVSQRLRDTLPRGARTPAENIRDQILWSRVNRKRGGNFELRELPRGTRKKLEASLLADKWLRKPEKQRHLAGRMAGYIADKYRRPLVKPFSCPEIGEKAFANMRKHPRRRR